MTPHVKCEHGITVLSRLILKICVFILCVYSFCCVIFVANKIARGEINAQVRGDFSNVSLAAGVFIPGEHF